MKFSVVVVLSAASIAVAEHGHHHGHLHAARHGSPVEARTAVTEVVDGSVFTVYELNGKDIPWTQVEEGLKDGIYVLLPPATTSTSPTSSTPKPTSTSTPSPQVFLQKTTSTTSIVVPPTTSSTPKPTTTSVAPAPVSTSSATGLNANFPSGTIPCAEFPSNYGAVEVPWLELGGWTGVQLVPGFVFDILSNASIVNIANAIAGKTCSPGSFCSYACPPGYQKSQWPRSQGSTGESIGGLYCNPNGMLELTNTEWNTICIPGTGGVQVQNTLSQNVCICRTDYPGTEGETVPLDATPGGTFPLTCPDASTYYHWEGAETSAQYYVNPAGAPCSEACIWGSAGTNLGNWAPLNIGVGWSDGVTFISLFPNHPTNPDGKLNFNIKITGVSGDCAYTGGQYLSNGAVVANGCTVSVSSPEGATFIFSS